MEKQVCDDRGANLGAGIAVREAKGTLVVGSLLVPLAPGPVLPSSASLVQWSDVQVDVAATLRLDVFDERHKRRSLVVAEHLALDDFKALEVGQETYNTCGDLVIQELDATQGQVSCDVSTQRHGSQEATESASLVAVAGRGAGLCLGIPARMNLRDHEVLC